MGVTSYFLVIYYLSFKSLNSGILTAASNRLGDGFLIGVISLFLTRETLLYTNKPNLHYIPGIGGYVNYTLRTPTPEVDP